MLLANGKNDDKNLSEKKEGIWVLVTYLVQVTRELIVI